MAKSRRAWWLIRREDFEHMQASTVLDALRYDGAVVENNPPPGFYLFSAGIFGLKANPNVPEARRLASFGLQVQAATFGGDTTPVFDLERELKYKGWSGSWPNFIKGDGTRG